MTGGVLQEMRNKNKKKENNLTRAPAASFKDFAGIIKASKYA